jgi:hypothetical protein
LVRPAFSANPLPSSHLACPHCREKSWCSVLLPLTYSTRFFAHAQCAAARLLIDTPPLEVALEIDGSLSQIRVQVRSTGTKYAELMKWFQQLSCLVLPCPVLSWCAHLTMHRCDKPAARQLPRTGVRFTSGIGQWRRIGHAAATKGPRERDFENRQHWRQASRPLLLTGLRAPTGCLALPVPSSSVFLSLFSICSSCPVTRSWPASLAPSSCWSRVQHAGVSDPKFRSQATRIHYDTFL